MSSPGRSAGGHRSGRSSPTLLPHGAACGRHRLHPLDDRANRTRTGRRENFDEHRLHCSTAFPAPARGSATRSAARTRTCRRSSPSPIRAACRRTARATGATAFLPAAYQGTPFSAAPADPQPRAPGRRSPATRRCRRATFSQQLNARARGGASRRQRTRARIAATNSPRACSSPRRRSRDLSRGAGARARTATAPTTRNPLKAAYRPQLPARPAAARDAACASCSSSTARVRQRATGCSTGTGTRRSRPTTTRHGPILDQPTAALLTRPEAARPAGRHARRLVHRVRPHADVSRKAHSGRDHNPDGFTGWLAGAGVKRGVQLRRDRRLRPPRRRERRHASTTSTPRSCTCSASITSGSPSTTTASTAA